MRTYFLEKSSHEFLESGLGIGEIHGCLESVKPIAAATEMIASFYLRLPDLTGLEEKSPDRIRK
jgi:hypothetical protein